MRKLTKTAAVVAAMATMAMGTTVMASAAQEGWVQSGSTWYYYVGGDKVENQWVQAGNDWYFLGDDGKMLTNAFVQEREELDDETVDFDATDEDEGIYYVGSNGAMVTGWVKVDYKKLNSNISPLDSTNWYYFGGSGAMLGDAWVKSGDNWYYVCDNGIMVKNTYVEDDDDTYYMGKDGVMVTGWYKLTDDDENKSATSWNDRDYSGDAEASYAKTIGTSGNWVYADEDGELQDGWAKVDSKWYYLGPVTAAAVGETTGTAINADYDYQMVEEQFIYVDGNWFYAKSNGAIATDGFKVDKVQYYAKSSGAIRRNDITSINGKYRLFYADGTSEDDGYAVKWNGGSKRIYLGDISSKSAAENAANAALKTDGAPVGTSYTLYKLGTSTTYSLKSE